MDSCYFVQGLSRGDAWQQGHLPDHRLNQLVAKEPEVQAVMEQLRLGHGEGDVHRLTGVVHAAMQGICFDEALHFLTSSVPQAGAIPHELLIFNLVPKRARISANGMTCSLCWPNSIRDVLCTQGALPDRDAAALAKEAGALAFGAGRLDDAVKSYTGQVVPHSRSSSLNTVPQEVSDLAQVQSQRQ